MWRILDKVHVGDCFCGMFLFLVIGFLTDTPEMMVEDLIKLRFLVQEIRKRIIYQAPLELLVEIGKSLHVTDRIEWRNWLEENHKTEDEIWLVHYKKHTGKPRIPYDDAVEEAICFGWIDGIVKKIDEEKYAQRYTPRKKKSVWSDLNKSRAKKMIELGKMTMSGLEKLGDHLNEEVTSPKKEFEIPLDLKDSLISDPKAWENFNNFAPSYRRDYIGWVLDAKREDTRQRRISAVVKRSKDNIKPGMM